MNKINFIVDRWISEEIENLRSVLTNAINNKLRIHIKAPVHTGKTTFAIDQIVTRKDENQILVLAPMVAITNHIYNELKEKSVQAFIFNSETRENFTQDDLTNPILCTFDSAHLFFNGEYEHQLDPSSMFCNYR